MTHRICFVCGIHGCGKTYLARELSSLLCVDAYSSGSLIKRHTPQAVPDIGKSVVDVCRNQEILLKAIKEVPSSAPWFILDGHMALWNSMGEVQKIDVDFFLRLNIGLIIFVNAEPSEVFHRLMSRDGCSLSMNSLGDYLGVEREHAGFVAKYLGVELVEARSGDAAVICDVIRRIMSG